MVNETPAVECLEMHNKINEMEAWKRGTVDGEKYWKVFGSGVDILSFDKIKHPGKIT